MLQKGHLNIIILGNLQDPVGADEVAFCDVDPVTANYPGATSEDIIPRSPWISAGVRGVFSPPMISGQTVIAFPNATNLTAKLFCAFPPS